MKGIPDEIKKFIRRDYLPIPLNIIGICQALFLIISR